MNPIVELSPETLKKINELITKHSGVSETSQVILSIVPIVGVLFGTFLFFSLIYFYHRQKMLMIETGMYKPVRMNWSLILVLSGSIILMSGIAITLVFLINCNTGHELLGGLIPTGIGIAILLSYFASNQVKSDRQ